MFLIILSIAIVLALVKQKRKIMSRPKRPKKFHQHKTVRVCVTPEQHKLIERVAKKLGLPMSEWARNELLKLAQVIDAT